MPRSAEVEAWFARYENPMKDVVLRMREIILGADPRIEECIKWQAPTFTFAGNLASFFPKSKQHASLMFHTGAKIPGDHPRLEGSGDTSRVMKIGSVAEANAARKDLERLVRAWCDWRAGSEPAATKRAAPANPRASAPKKARRRYGRAASRRGGALTGAPDTAPGR
jgi:uncharacterized protein YdhG (YjbR/CyaY superfamily)